MEYTKIGNTDIEVSRLCIGCMSFGKAGTMHDWTLDETESEKVIRHALDLGINFFDTANGYSAGTSEEYLGKAIKNNVARDKVVIASKVYFNEGRLSKEAIAREIDSTLSRLGTDYLDLYIIHRFDYETPIEETMEALHELVKAGKVRALGASAMYGYQFHNMQLAAKEHGWTQFSAMENHYNLLYREDEREPDLQTDECHVDAVQSACSRTSGKTNLEIRQHAWQDGSCCNGQIRPDGRDGYEDRRPCPRAGREVSV